MSIANRTRAGTKKHFYIEVSPQVLNTLYRVLSALWYKIGESKILSNGLNRKAD